MSFELSQRVIFYHLKWKNKLNQFKKLEDQIEKKINESN